MKWKKLLCLFICQISLAQEVYILDLSIKSSLEDLMTKDFLPTTIKHNETFTKK